MQIGEATDFSCTVHSIAQLQYTENAALNEDEFSANVWKEKQQQK
jgi:hypothetical protein